MEQETRTSQPRKVIKNIDSLAVSDTKAISDRLSTLLWATNGAYTHVVRAFMRNANEAERRHDWDEILYKFFVTNAVVVSLDVLYAAIMVVSYS